MFRRWFCARLYSAYNGVKNEEQITKLNQEWAPKSFEFILDLGAWSHVVQQWSHFVCVLSFLLQGIVLEQQSLLLCCCVLVVNFQFRP